MLLAAALFLTAATATPPPQGGATATATAHVRILSRLEVRRVGGRIEVQTGRRDAPTQFHRTERRDGGATADFY